MATVDPFDVPFEADRHDRSALTLPTAFPPPTFPSPSADPLLPPIPPPGRRFSALTSLLPPDARPYTM